MANPLVGGEKLRALRRERRDKHAKRLTIERLAEEVGCDYRTLSDIERGIAQRPPLETLHRILNTLSKFAPVSTEDKNIVLNAYGYHSILDFPTPDEIEKACRDWNERYHHLRLPSYLVISLSQQLLSWNRYAPLILGIKYGASELETLKGITILDLAFNPQFIAASRIENGEEFLPKLVRIIKSEMQLFRYESWYQDFVAENSQKYPLFKTIWESLPDDLPSVDVRTIGPVHVRHPNGKLLKFQLLGIDFVDDPRFRAVQYHPVDSVTLSEWNTWVEQEGE